MFFHVCLSAVNVSFTGAHWPSWTNRSSRNMGRSWWNGECSLSLDLDPWGYFDPSLTLSHWNMSKGSQCPGSVLRGPMLTHTCLTWFSFVCVCVRGCMRACVLVCVCDCCNKCICPWFITVKHTPTHMCTDRCSVISQFLMVFITLLSKDDGCQFITTQIPIAYKHRHRFLALYTVLVLSTS